MASDSNTWKPLVQFHFRVDFQWKTSKASASFVEGVGPGQEFVLDSRPVKSNNVPRHSDKMESEWSECLEE